MAVAAVAGGAVSIPIIIHLLNRRRFKVVTWAAMRFLLAAQKKNSRRMRLEQILLLALRCLVVLLLVLAMASVTPLGRGHVALVRARRRHAPWPPAVNARTRSSSSIARSAWD